MKKFKFPLEVILKLRENKEEECRIRLGRITAESQRIRKEMDQHRHLLRTTGAACHPADFQAVEFYRNRLTHELTELDGSLIRNETKREKAKDDYIQAVSQLQVYRKLRERRLKEHRKAAAREEGKMLDEMNQMRRNRREYAYGG